MDIGFDGVPVEVDVGSVVTGAAGGVAPCLGVDGGSADVVMGYVDEVCEWLGGRMFVDPGAEPGANDLIGLCGVDLREGLAEMLSGF